MISSWGAAIAAILSFFGLQTSDLPPWLGVAVFALIVVVAGAVFVRGKITVARSVLFAWVVVMGALLAASIGLFY